MWAVHNNGEGVYQHAQVVLQHMLSHKEDMWRPQREAQAGKAENRQWKGGSQHEESEGHEAEAVAGLLTKQRRRTCPEAKAYQRQTTHGGWVRTTVKAVALHLASEGLHNVRMALQNVCEAISIVGGRFFMMAQALEGLAEVREARQDVEEDMAEEAVDK
jgi:hypothetical protein